MLFHIINVITAYRPNYLSKKIKKETKEIHDKIEKHPFFFDLVTGQLSDYKYVIYLNNLYPIYKAVEVYFLSNKNVKEELLQSNKIEKDIREYCRLLNVDVSSPDLYFTQKWLDYFLQKENFLKKAELYIRWLADMYGGQVIKKKVKFGNKYEFNNLREDIKFIRSFLEEDLTDNNVDKFIEEVKKSYQFHYDLVNQIYDNIKEPVQ